MCDKVEQADQDWRGAATEFVKFAVGLGIIAVFLELVVFAYFTNDDLKKAEASAVYWKGRADGRP